MTYITSIGLANPSYLFAQSAIADFMIRALRLDEQDAMRLRALYRATGIDSRHSVLDDYGKNEDFTFYGNADRLEPLPTTQARLALYRRHALELSVRSARECLKRTPPEKLTHLIVVSCTGMYSPGLDIDLIRELKLNSDIERTCINFMGCYAAFTALKLANTICYNSADSKVLIVCTELCSIHFQREHTDDNLLANALFADGSAALMVEGTPRPGLNLRPLAFYCDILPEGEGDMSWTVGNLGFEMKLSTYVPDVIQRGIKQLTSRLLSRLSMRISDIDYYAIHPGGKKILEVIEKELGLTYEQNYDAYEVLRKYGNMSSPTVLFVLNRISSRLNGVDNGKHILSFAFGPGLTMESMVLAVESV